MRLSTRNTVACVALLLALCAGSARAETGEGGSAAERAREHFDRGNSYFDAGQFDNAIKEFEQSYAIKPVPLLLFDIGNVARVSGKNEMAIEYFRRYLRQAPAGTKERTEARRYLAEMTKPGYKAPPPPAPPAPEAPPPAPVAAPAPAPAPAPAAALPPPIAPHTDTPVYKKWWLWTIVGVGVAAGVGVGLGLGLTQSSGYTYPNVPGSVGTVKF
jgi:hypothetical protein